MIGETLSSKLEGIEYFVSHNLMLIRSPHVQVRPQLTLHDIKPSPHCIACGNETRKQLIEYWWGDQRFVVYARKAPGYRCPKDGLEFLSKETLINLLPKARDAFKEKGYISKAQDLDSTIESLKLRTSVTS